MDKIAIISNIHGNIHATFARTLYRHQKTLFNSGSGGNPLDEPTAAYAILEGQLHGPTPAPFAVQIVRLPYDIERAITLAAEKCRRWNCIRWS
jgi:hypothetical protein